MLGTDRAQLPVDRGTSGSIAGQVSHEESERFGASRQRRPADSGAPLPELLPVRRVTPSCVGSPPGLAQFCPFRLKLPHIDPSKIEQRQLLRFFNDVSVRHDSFSGVATPAIMLYYHTTGDYFFK